MSENTSNTPTFFYDTYLDAIDCHPLIKSLAKTILKGNKPKRDWFSNDVNYYYYMLYVRPKLLSKNREISIFGRKRLKSYTKSLMISNNYIGVYIKVKVESKYYGYDNEYGYMYVIGVDRLPNKLFVNKVNRFPSVSEQNCYEDFNIAFVDDKVFYEVFGFEYDFDDDSCTTITLPGNYRVQGEIILLAEKVVNNLMTHIINNFEMDIRHYIYALALDRLYGILMEIGYNPRVVRAGRDVELRIDMKIDKKQFSQFINNVTKVLKKYFYDVDNEIYSDNAKIFARASDLGKITYYFRERKNLDRIEIFVDCTDSEIASITVEELKDAFYRLPKSDFEFWVGEHKIKVKNAYSLRMNYVPKIQPIFLNLFDINSYENAFGVDENSVVEIDHKEHGKKSLKFNDTYIIRFTTTNVSEFFIRERNKVVNYTVAKRLAKK